MSTAQRQTLSRELIAQTALGLTDDVGLDGLSMRKLGGRLGVEAMSLYHYVDSKDDLLDAVLDRLYCEIDLPTHIGDDQWEQALRLGLSSFRDVLLRHPAALELFSSRPAQSPTSLDVLHWAYSRFELMGLSPEQSSIAFRFAVSFVIGHAADEMGFSAFSKGKDDFDVSSLADPKHREFLDQHDKLCNTEVFAGGLDLVVAGLRATYSLLV
jgi:AcrR family transcriptional regulator